MQPTTFATPADFRAWLKQHHDSATELWVGYHKKATGKPSMTWQESVDEALCYGWIDGRRKRIDDERYMIRFTPRRRGSVWSTVNVARVAELTKQRRMRAAGRRAFEARREDRSGIYSYENRHRATLDPAYERRFRAKKRAWADFEARPRWYRQAAIRWVMSAKKEETRERRLAQLMSDSAAARAIPQLSRND
ncbi:MAG TPA: YdeI/OmpD-associated family protein [Actinomycetota bacterium]|nr:YdeI/OmpD-associated family protein [Actinomycetota bacterium]